MHVYIRGVVDDRDRKAFEEERLYATDEKAVFQRIHCHREKIVEVLEEDELTDS